MRVGKQIYALCVVLCLCASHVSTAVPGKIKHIIVLMEENRSFDSMFGYYQGVNGVTGKEFNYVDTTNTSSTKVMVDNAQPQQAYCDPDHSTAGTTAKIFGAAAVAKGDFSNPTMSGFIERENKLGHAKLQYCGVMSMMSPKNVPVITQLAQEFSLFDRLFCDHPGPTWPNRLFALSATSAGCTATGTYYHNKPSAQYPQKTFFDQIDAEGLTWRNYYNDTPWESFLTTIAQNTKNVVPLQQFYDDARTGNLPHYAWINPRLSPNVTTGEASNDQHPDHDVSLGEKFYKDVYEALRASPQWNETLFIVTYDEHGGFWDHVPTPLNVPAPGDGEDSYPDKNFMFDRLGVRIPTLLISPWIPKGTLVSAPPAAQKPAPNSEYALTSIMATARILLGMKSTPLTKRDAWAATFEHVLSLSEPRTDCPLHLTEAAKPYPLHSVEREANLPVNGLQEDVMRWHAALIGADYPSHIRTQAEAGEWLQKAYNKHLENMEQQE